MKQKFEEMKYYMLDWDDSCLYMSTKIHTEKLINGVWTPYDVSTSEFKDIRKLILEYNETGIGEYRFPNNDPNEAYLEFRDFGLRGDNAFYLDTVESIKNKAFGPSWNDLIECLVGGHLFLIITARGHEPISIRKSFEYIIETILTEEQKRTMICNLKKFNIIFDDFIIDDEKELLEKYLDLCEFIGINSEYYKSKFNTQGLAVDPGKYKSLAIEYFVNKIFKYKTTLSKLKIGFSDDDVDTVQYVTSFIKDELSLKYPMEYYIYNTEDGITKEKIKKTDN